MAKQLSFKKVSGWGGKRKGAGRKNQSGTVAHEKRARVALKHPIHINLKVRPGIVNLRSHGVHKQFKYAIKKAQAHGLGVSQYSLQDNHIHLICEARNNGALSSGMKSFGSRFGKALAKASGQKKGAFKGRFHLHVLKSPTEVKNALKYVLLNESKHMKSIEFIDEYSSGYSFKHWHKLMRIPDWMEVQLIEARPADWSHLAEAKSWLLSEGWIRAAS